LLVVTGDGATGHVMAGGGMMIVFDGRVGLRVRVSHAAVANPVAGTHDGNRPGGDGALVRD
jgi:hypothetical protein